jgi:hypothetical protein
LSKDMADHRKFFRPRRLAFGGRLLPYAWLLALLLALFNVAHAEDAGLKNGAASLAAGKYDNAVRQLSVTINAAGVSSGEAAKALYLRGIAYRKLGQPSRAIADLGAAIWLGLPEGDRVKALVNRGLAFQSAGLAKEGETDVALARKSGGSGQVDQLIADGGGSTEGAAAIAAFATEVRPEAQAPSARTADNTTNSGERPASAPKPPQDAAPSSWSTSVSGDAPQSSSSSSGNRLTRWFGSLTDSSDSSAAAAPPPQPSSARAPAPAPSAPRAAPQPMPAPSSWAAKTETQAADSGGAGGGGSRWGRWFSSKSAEAEPAPAAAPAVAGGGFRLQLATSRSEQEAQALWKKVSSENQVVAGAQPEIEKVDIGNFGTFYSLKIGPFPDKAESLKVCNALKRNGVDCSLAEAQ